MKDYHLKKKRSMSSEENLFESESEEGFSASEDDWKPPKKGTRKRKPEIEESSSDTESDVEPEVSDSESPGDEKTSRKRQIRRRSSKRKKAEPKTTHRPLFKKYKSSETPQELSALPTSVNELLKKTEFRTNRLILNVTHESSQPSTSKELLENDSDSSSGDDYLMDPKQIDLDSEFFKVIEKNPEGITPKIERETSQTHFENGVKGSNSASKSEKGNNSELQKVYEQNMLFESSKEQLENLAKKLQEKKKKKNCTENTNIADLLKVGETVEKVEVSRKIRKKKKDSDDSDWDIVDEKVNEKQAGEFIENVEILLEIPDEMRRKNREKKETDMEAILIRKLNRVKKEVQILMHKVHILGWIAFGNRVNCKTLNNPNIFLKVLKTLPGNRKKCFPQGETDIKYFEQITAWFKRTFRVKDKYVSPPFKTPELCTSITLQIIEKHAICKRDYVLMFVILMRAMGFQCRLVINLVTVPIRPKTLVSSNCKSKLFDKYKQNNEPSIGPQTSLEEIKRNKTGPVINDARSKPKGSTKTKVIVKTPFKNEMLEKRSSDNKVPSPRKTRRQRQQAEKEAKEENVSNSIEKLDTKKPKIKTKRFKRESDEDFSPEVKLRPANKILTKAKKIDSRVLSTDTEDTGPKRMDYWAEVYTESEKRWIAIDLFKGEVNCVEQLCRTSTTPMAYVLAWNNNNTLKDVSPRYCEHWNTATRKLRVEKEWFDESIRPFLGERTERDKLEDKFFKKIHSSKPLPTVISDFKNHPLYALERHLLKNEALYPPDVAPIGWVRKEPIYPRDCVYTLITREKWVKEARVVKLNETAYKIVYGPKWDKFNRTILKQQPSELFGIWQTEEYTPPVAENGIVPRNEYGNVELFKACMLPINTVHLRLPNLNKVCRKLGIDCASAITGFDFHSGWSHPVYDGFVVCKEFEEIVTEAWYEEQREEDRKSREKFEKRVYDNWKKLIKGVLIRAKLQAKYNFERDKAPAPLKKQHQNKTGRK